MAEPLASPAAPSPVAARKRPRWKLVPLVLLALGMAFLAWFLPVHIRYRRQWEAIAFIERHGGSVEAHSAAPEWLLRLRSGEYVRPGYEPIGPNWFRKCLPARFIVRYFLVIDGVSVDNGPGNRALSDISGERRDVHREEITNDEVAYIARFPQLERLYLRNTDVGDEGLEHLHKLRHLKHLYLSFTQITDKSAETLAGFENLEMLRLVGTPITDAGLIRLQGLKHLRELDVRGTRVTSAGLVPFQARSGLLLLWDDPDNPRKRFLFSY